jgi:hypothetical protein
VGSGQPTERKTKKLGNIRLVIGTDLREFKKENLSQRISEGLEATRSEQQQGTSARNIGKRILDQNNLMKRNSNLFKINSKTSLYPLIQKRKILNNNSINGRSRIQGNTIRCKNFKFF